jgi:hypothetical protein
MINSNTHLAFELSENALHIAEIQGKEVKTIHFEEIQKSTSTSLETQVERILNEITFQPIYADYTLSWIDSNFTLVPSTLTKIASIEDLYLKCSSACPPLSTIEQNTINELSICNLFPIPNWVTPLFVKFFPRIIIQHAYSHLLRGLTINTLEPQLILSIYKTHIDLALFKNKQLVVSNAYEYLNENDILYFSSLVLQHNDCNFKEGNLNIYISKEANEEIIESFTQKWKFIKDFASFKLHVDNQQLIKFQFACV